MADPIVTGTIGETGAKTGVALVGNFDLSIKGITSATVVLQRSFDGGATWGNVKSYTADAEDSGYAAMIGIYRLNCTVYGSGTITYVLGKQQRTPGSVT